MAVLKWNGRCWMVLIRSQAWDNSPWLCALPSRLWFHPQSDPQKACASQLISFLSLLPVNRILGPQRFPFVLFLPLSVQAGYVCLNVFSKNFQGLWWIFAGFFFISLKPQTPKTSEISCFSTLGFFIHCSYLSFIVLLIGYVRLTLNFFITPFVWLNCAFDLPEGFSQTLNSVLSLGFGLFTHQHPGSFFLNSSSYANLFLRKWELSD